MAQRLGTERLTAYMSEHGGEHDALYDARANAFAFTSQAACFPILHTLASARRNSGLPGLHSWRTMTGQCSTRRFRHLSGSNLLAGAQRSRERSPGHPVMNGRTSVCMYITHPVPSGIFIILRRMPWR